MDVCLVFVRIKHEKFGRVSHLRGFNVVVEVVAECLDVGDNLISSLSSQMPWEEDCEQFSMGPQLK
jgi:hypothetical protein